MSSPLLYMGGALGSYAGSAYDSRAYANQYGPSEWRDICVSTTQPLNLSFYPIPSPTTTCSYCRSRNLTSTNCPNCGAPV